jgi:tellurite resistance-related uncharacterized protein
MTAPYKTTAVFTEVTLPAALRREHRTKAGAWGIIRLLEGKLKLSFPDGRTELLDPELAGLIRPEETHWVEPLGPMRMQVEFYDSEPSITRN